MNRRRPIVMFIRRASWNPRGTIQVRRYEYEPPCPPSLPPCINITEILIEADSSDLSLLQTGSLPKEVKPRIEYSQRAIRVHGQFPDSYSGTEGLGKS